MHPDRDERVEFYRSAVDGSKRIPATRRAAELPHQCRRAVRADADQLDRGSGKLFEAADVLLRFLGKLGEAAAAGEVGQPESGLNRCSWGVRLLMIRDRIERMDRLSIPDYRGTSMYARRMVLPFVFCACIFTLPVAAQMYHLTDLGHLGHDFLNIPEDINAAGQVTGSSWIPASVPRAFLWSGGVMRDLGALGSGTSSSAGHAINTAGQIAGESETNLLVNSFRVQHAFLYSNGTMQDLGSLAGSGGSSYALGINAAGQVVGNSAHGGGPGTHAFLYSSGTMSDLGTLGGVNSRAVAINSAGQIVGYSDNRSIFPHTHAFLYSGGQMLDLGTLGGVASDSWATDINDNGEVVGYSDAPGDTSAFLYSNGTMHNLGYGIAYGINSSGQIVGWRRDAKHQYAALYTGGAWIDLSTKVDSSGAGWQIRFATAINDAGWIVGHGYTPDTYDHAFLLTPLPEPADLAMGMACVLAWRACCRRI
jgi:probable HAF family extracellular repeat protein